jgi:hypothetical protein
VLGVRKDGFVASRYENEMTAPSDPAGGAEPEEAAGTDNREDNMGRGESMGEDRHRCVVCNLLASRGSSSRIVRK